MVRTMACARTSDGPPDDLPDLLGVLDHFIVDKLGGHGFGGVVFETVAPTITDHDRNLDGGCADVDPEDG